jgi:hypothetical protein
MRKRSLGIPVRVLGIAVLTFLAIGLDLPLAKAGADETDKPLLTIDGRFNSNCLRQSAFTEEPVCIVPFSRLIAEPERFDGKYILILGFYVDHFGTPALFSSTESFKHSLPLESIYVGKTPSELAASLKKGIWVRVVGKFDAKFSGPMMNLGAIWEPLDISPLEDGNKLKSPPLPPFKVPNPPAATMPSLK